jgi:glycosyltransferase involved in cell wall biosynthesis
MTQILLTIGVPTFNGAKTINHTIDSIISQFDNFAISKIEILVSDNKSTDSTLNIINKYKLLYPDNFRIVINQKNDLKLDGNLLNLFNLANGKFVWILSDDDVLEKNSIDYILKIIENYKNDLAVIMTNYSECDYQLEYKKIRYREEIYEDVYCEKGDDFFIKSRMLFGLISSLIINRQSWLNSNLKQYIGLNSLHIGALIQILNREKSFIVSKKLVKFRMDTENTEPRWGENGTFIIVIYQLIQMWHSMKFLNYKKKTMNYIIDNNYKNNYFMIALAKAKGLKDTKKAFIEMKKCYKHKKFFWIWDVPLLFIPNIFYEILYDLYKLYKDIKIAVRKKIT